MALEGGLKWILPRGYGRMHPSNRQSRLTWTLAAYRPGVALLTVTTVPKRRDVTNWEVTAQLPQNNASLFLGVLGLQYEAGLRAQFARISSTFPALPLLAIHTSLPFSYSRHVKVATRLLPLCTCGPISSPHVGGAASTQLRMPQSI